MKPIAFKGHIKVAAAPTFNGVRASLPGRYVNKIWETYWEPSKEELAAIRKGQRIRLQIMAVGHPTVWVDVKEVPE